MVTTYDLLLFNNMLNFIRKILDMEKTNDYWDWISYHLPTVVKKGPSGIENDE